MVSSLLFSFNSLLSVCGTIKAADSAFRCLELFVRRNLGWMLLASVPRLSLPSGLLDWSLGPSARTLECRTSCFELVSDLLCFVVGPKVITIEPVFLMDSSYISLLGSKDSVFSRLSPVVEQVAAVMLFLGCLSLLSLTLTRWLRVDGESASQTSSDLSVCCKWGRVAVRMLLRPPKAWKEMLSCTDDSGSGLFAQCELWKLLVVVEFSADWDTTR